MISASPVSAVRTITPSIIESSSATRYSTKWQFDLIVTPTERGEMLAGYMLERGPGRAVQRNPFRTGSEEATGFVDAYITRHIDHEPTGREQGLAVPREHILERGGCGLQQRVDMASLGNPITWRGLVGKWIALYHYDFAKRIDEYASSEQPCHTSADHHCSTLRF